MTGPIKVRTLAQLQAVVSSGSDLVIVDTARPPSFHADPVGCTHIQEAHFTTKVVDNGERNGSYFVVESLAAAREEWPTVRVCGSPACAAAAGDGEGEASTSPLVVALREATGFSEVTERKREPIGAEVMPPNWISTQRLALGQSGSLVLRTWPGELKRQANALYSSDRAARLLELSATGWEISPLPHLAYNGSRPEDRFYFRCPQTAGEYVSFWSRPENLERAGGHSQESVTTDLWPWLCENRIADPGAPDELRRFDERLQKRRAAAHLRPSIEVTRTLSTSPEDDPAALIREVRAAAREVAGALREDLPLT